MRELKEMAVVALEHHPDWMRQKPSDERIDAMASSFKAVGQKVPILVFDKYVVDGNTRLLAAKKSGKTHLLAMVLDHMPRRAEALRWQWELDANHHKLTLMEQSNVLFNTQKENGWSISQTAVEMGMKQPHVSYLLKFQTACPELKAMLQAGNIDGDKAFLICGMDEHDEQRKLLAEAGKLSREQLRQRVRTSNPKEQKVSVACFALKGGTSVMVRGNQVCLSSAIEALLQVIKELKRGQSQCLDVKTVAAVLADRAKGAGNGQ